MTKTNAPPSAVMHEPTTGPDVSAGGIYLAYPTSTSLKPTYINRSTLVNNLHTKFGKAVQLASRQKSYQKTFDGEVVFVPILTIRDKALRSLIELTVLAVLRGKYDYSGRDTEWFRTQDRQQIFDLAMQIGREILHQHPDSPPPLW